MNTHTPLGALIAHECTALGCTVKTFCKECGITMKTYYRLIEKKATPRSYAKVIAYLYETKEASERVDFALRFTESFCASF